MSNELSRRLRALGPKGLSDYVIDRENRVIRGFSVIQRGEGLGHGHWVDEQMLDEIVTLGNSSGNGFKSRFTHPGLSADGLGSSLGRGKSFRRSGDRVLADLHLLSEKTSKSGPRGDLGEYVMNLAEEDPDQFGASIVFFSDPRREREFSAANLDDDGRFKTPDPLNKKNLPHWRAAELTAVDLVDTPAANRDGFLHAGEEMADLADRSLAFALGLSEIDPGNLAPGVTSLRFRQFFQEFLDRRGLVLNKKENEMSKENKAPEKVPATLSQLKSSYPGESEFILSQLEAEATEEQADRAFFKIKQERLAAERAEFEKEREQFAAKKADLSSKPAPRGSSGVDPLEFSGSSENRSGLNFRDQAKQLAKEEKITLTEAYKRLASEQPDLYRSFVTSA